MCMMLVTLFNIARDSGFVTKYWREGLIVRLFKKGDREYPGNYKGVTLLNLVGRLCSRIINGHLLKFLKSSHKLHEGQGALKLVDLV